MNSEQLTIMAQTIELSDTIYHGLRYVEQQLESGDFEDSYEIMGSVLCGMEAIKKALPCVINYIPPNEIGTSTMQLRDILEMVKEGYLDREEETVLAIVKNMLIPVYSDWYQEVHQHFMPYICH